MTLEELSRDTALHPKRIAAQSAPTYAPRFKALGLTSRSQAWVVAIVGLLLAAGIVGVPLMLWGFLADAQFVEELRRRGHSAIRLSTFFVGFLLLAIVTAVATVAVLMVIHAKPPH